MSRIGIEFLCVFGMPPVDLVNLTADLGCGYITTVLDQGSRNPYNYSRWSLRDAAYRRETIKALKDRNIAISLGEGLMISPDKDVRDHAADLDIMAELGVIRVNTLSLDSDMGRSFDQFAVFAEMADQRGLKSSVEFCPLFTIRDLVAGLAAVRHVNLPSFQLCVDTMHFCRTGGKPADIAVLDPKLIGHVQLCDAPAESTQNSYMDEAMYERMVPGTGEFPLAEVLKVLPADIVIGLEVPQRSLAEAGVGARERVQKCVDGARALLQRAGKPA